MFNSLLSQLLQFALLSQCMLAAAGRPDLKFIMYLTGQHDVVPEFSRISNVTHVALAFMRSEVFNDANRTTWPLFTTVAEVRSKFAAGTVIQIAIGGWGNSEGFERAAKTEESRRLFATNVKTMLDATRADGVDIDWEYPGGNGEDYKTHPNTEKSWQIAAYPDLLAAVRLAIGSSKFISAAVPGLPRDMLAFTKDTIPKIMESVDDLNVMTYDLMNRRDNVTKHHTGLTASMEAIDAYIKQGVSRERLNLGLAYYIRWFRTAEGVDCTTTPIGCKTELMEDATTGADLGKAGAFSWHDKVPSELATSLTRALKDGRYDQTQGGHYYWDKAERLFWSWDTPEAIKIKVPALVERRKLGGVFAWGLGEDAPAFEHLDASNSAIKALVATGYGGARRRERSEL